MHLEVTPTGTQLPEALAQCQDYDTVIVRQGVCSFSPLPPTTETWQAHPDGGAAMTLRGRKGVRIIGDHGPLLKFTPGSGLCIMDCQDIDVSGLTFQGTGYTLTPEKWYFALMLLAGHNTGLRVHECSFWDSGNHGIGHLMGGSTDDSRFERNIFLRGGHLNRPSDVEGQPALGGDGAALAVRGSRNVYRRNLIVDWLRGIEIEAKDNDASNNVVEENELRNVFWHGVFITPTGGDPSRCKRNIIRHNLLTSGPGMGAFKMAHPIYVSGGLCQLIDHNHIMGKDGDWCGIDASADHCELSVGILNNWIYNTGRFGIGAGFNGKEMGHRSASIGWNYLGGCGGAGIGYIGTNVYVFGNRIGAVIPRDGVQQPIYAPDDPTFACCWDNQT